MTTSTPQPDIRKLDAALEKARKGARDDAHEAHSRALGHPPESTPDPPASELIGLAAVEAVIGLTAQVHHLTVAVREHTAELEQARWRTQQV